MTQNEPGDDPKMLIRRAKKHFDEFKSCRDGHVVGPMWDVRHRAVEGGYAYWLILNRALFVELKPIVADLANNVIHSTDLLVSELARARGADRDFSIKFPWVAKEDDFQVKLRNLAEVIGNDAASKIDAVRQKWKAGFQHIHALKTISNLGKHWELVPSTAQAAAVAWQLSDGKQEIWDVPKDAFDNSDEYQLRIVPELFTAGCYIWMSFKFSGLPRRV